MGADSSLVDRFYTLLDGDTFTTLLMVAVFLLTPFVPKKAG
jgi:hypothetical protein